MTAAISTSAGLEPGTIVDARYCIQHEIGRGNMATVYLATDELTGREVALKVMSERLAGRLDRVRRFIKEHELGSQIGQHENIVATLAHGRLGGNDGTPYLVMERIVGPSLDLMLAMHQQLDTRQAIGIALGIAKGLEAIHRAGVVHRDIKPSNVLVARLEGGVEVAKLLDFGLAIRAHASRRDEQRTRLTLHTQLPGSAGYMAPEVVARADPHPSVDVFGFGMLLVELLTGRHPYEGLARDEYLTEITRRDWTLADAVLDEIEASELRGLVLWCTRRDADERPSMAEVIDALGSPLEPSVAAVDSMAATQPRGQHSEDVESRSGTPAKRWMWIAIVMVLAVAAALVVVVLNVPEHDSSRPGEQRPQAGSLAPLAVVESDGNRGVGEQGSSTDLRSSDTTDETAEDVAATTGPALDRRPRRKKRGQARTPGQRRGSTSSESLSPSPPDEKAPRASVECELLHDSIASMRAEGGWSRVLFLIKANRGCFDRAEYRRLRVEALARTGKYKECVKAGAGSNDPAIEAWVDECKRNEP